MSQYEKEEQENLEQMRLNARQTARNAGIITPGASVEPTPRVCRQLCRCCQLSAVCGLMNGDMQGDTSAGLDRLNEATAKLSEMQWRKINDPNVDDPSK